MTKKTYSELIKLETYEERVKYLQTGSIVGDQTFGSHRVLNQRFYQTPEWRTIRRNIIIRDNGCDLGLEDCPIFGTCYIHHLNPITSEDILNRDPKLFDPENLICVTFDTHQLIHYGIEPRSRNPTERTPNDTCPWKVR